MVVSVVANGRLHVAWPRPVALPSPNDRYNRQWSRDPLSVGHPQNVFRNGPDRPNRPGKRVRPFFSPNGTAQVRPFGAQQQTPLVD